MRSGKRRQAGFTLVEVIVGLGVLGFLMVAMAGTFLVGSRTISQQARTISADEAISSASLYLTKDLSSASVVANGTINPPPGGGALQFRYGQPLITVTYSINANRQLLRQIGAAQPVVAAVGVQRMTVATGAPACYLTVTILPSAAGAAAKTLNISRRVLGCF